MNYGCCKNCSCVSKKVRDPGCTCNNHEIEEKWIDMAKRITIMLDDDLVKKLHEIQAKQIKASTKSVSFSRVLNMTLRKCIK